MAASGGFAGAAISVILWEDFSELEAGFTGDSGSVMRAAFLWRICNFVADFQHNVAVSKRGIAKKEAIVIIRNIRDKAKKFLWENALLRATAKKAGYGRFRAAGGDGRIFPGKF